MTPIITGCSFETPTLYCCCCLKVLIPPFYSYTYKLSIDRDTVLAGIFAGQNFHGFCGLHDIRKILCAGHRLSDRCFPKFHYTHDTLEYCNEKRRQVHFGPFLKMNTVQSKGKWRSRALDLRVKFNPRISPVSNLRKFPAMHSIYCDHCQCESCTNVCMHVIIVKLYWYI